MLDIVRTRQAYRIAAGLLSCLLLFVAIPAAAGARHAQKGSDQRGVSGPQAGGQERPQGAQHAQSSEHPPEPPPPSASGVSGASPGPKHQARQQGGAGHPAQRADERQAQKHPQDGGRRPGVEPQPAPAKRTSGPSRGAQGQHTPHHRSNDQHPAQGRAGAGAPHHHGPAKSRHGAAPAHDGTARHLTVRATAPGTQSAPAAAALQQELLPAGANQPSGTAGSPGAGDPALLAPLEQVQGAAAQAPPQGGQRARIADLALKAEVKKLHACLDGLPQRLRLLLELRTGVGRPVASLSAKGAARVLHVSAARVVHMQGRALTRLRVLARSGGCGEARQAAQPASLSVFAVPFGSEPGGGDPAAQQGRPRSAPKTRRLAHASSHSRKGDSLAGVQLPRGGKEVLMLVALILIVAVLGMVLFTDRLEIVWRYRQVRFRRARRLQQWPRRDRAASTARSSTKA